MRYSPEPDRSNVRLTVSVALATFNGARFLETQLASLQCQTAAPSEVVIVDDQSTDATLEICRVFAGASSIPVAIYQNSTRLGYRANFMRAASLCNSSLIAFCDQDDYWHPSKLERVTRTFGEHPKAQLVSHNAQIVDAEGRPDGGTLMPIGSGLQVLEPGSFPPWQYPLGFTQVFRREILEYAHLRELTHDFFDPTERLAHDQWVPLVAGQLGSRIVDSEVLVDYRQHSSNMFGIAAARKRSLSRRLIDRALRQADYGQLASSFHSISQALSGSPSLVQGASEFAAAARLYDRRHLIYRGEDFALRFGAWLSAPPSDISGRARNVRLSTSARLKDLLLGVGLGEKALKLGAPIDQRDSYLRFN